MGVSDEDLAVRVCKTHNRELEEDAKGRLVCQGPRRHVLAGAYEWKVVVKILDSVGPDKAAPAGSKKAKRAASAA